MLLIGRKVQYKQMKDTTIIVKIINSWFCLKSKNDYLKKIQEEN